ncbi:MAG: endonuclease VII domain-containing protein [Gammaproteobacteria bacterium]|nr:endonuclease VII domain-containing protein [Gammaproteobacteria bacterium]
MKQYRQSEKFKSTSRRYQYSKIGKIVAEKNRRNTVLKRGGITLEEYNQMFAKQNGCCAICGKHQSELKNRLAIDHNHETGEIRGLLCTSCNITLGWLEKIEKIDFVARVKTYRKI